MTPKKIRELPRRLLLDELERYYDSTPPVEAVETDYSLWECAETGLQFAWPMKPGNACFYEWVSGFSSYYPGLRWEYLKVQELLNSQKLEAVAPKVLDVGCGSGHFLKQLGSIIPSGNLFGLDLNEPAITECRKSGYSAYCGTIEAGLSSGAIKPHEFSVVTAFHCLEHVADPVGFMKALVKATAPGGRMFISTPYSPMSFESVRFDIMNHPPHHMTRWNLTAYRRLAELLGVEMRYYIPFSPSLRMALRVFRSLQYAPQQTVSRGKLCLDAIVHLPKLLALYRQQKDRARNNKGIGADVILVEFTIAAK